jgi:ribosomal protein S18 acetylase RimI-like enzyme
MKTLPSIIAGPPGSAFRLRLATLDDRECLRLWKNQNKQYYFHKKDISPDEQAAWFSGYLERQDDHVFMVEEEEGPAWTIVGVVACRLLQDPSTVDLYNIMRGARGAADRTNMGDALQTLCREIMAHYKEPITCKVLADNPALDWYARLGFEVWEDRGSYKLLGYKGRP